MLESDILKILNKKITGVIAHFSYGYDKGFELELKSGKRISVSPVLIKSTNEVRLKIKEVKR